MQSFLMVNAMSRKKKVNAILQSSKTAWHTYLKRNIQQNQQQIGLSFFGVTDVFGFDAGPLRGCVAEKASGTKAEYDQVGGL